MAISLFLFLSAECGRQEGYHSAVRQSAFTAGASLIVGILIGTFLVAPIVEDVRRERTPIAAEPQPATTASTGSAEPQTPFDIARAEGNTAMDEERYREAIAAYDRALAIRFDSDVATDRGVCFRLLNEPDRALAAFEFVTLKDPQHWKARYNRAVVLLQLGRVEEARAEATRVAAEQPNEPTVQKLMEAVAQPR